MKVKELYDYLESNFNVEIKELVRLQEFSSATSILYSPERLLDLVQIDSKDLNLLSINQIVAFHQNDGTWKIKAGIQSDGSIFVSADVVRRFSWPKFFVIFVKMLSPLGIETI